MADDNEEEIIEPEDDDSENEEDDGDGQPSEEDYSQYQDLGETTAAPRIVNNGSSASRGTLDESKQDNIKLSDMQATLKVLRPKFPIKELQAIADPIMSSRQFPAGYREKHKILTIAIMRQNPKLSARIVIPMVDAMLSIAYDGRGIYDALEAVGALSEEEYNKVSETVFGR